MKTLCRTKVIAGALAACGGLASPAHAVERLAEVAPDDARSRAVVFDFDTDSCYPSPAISPKGQVNPGIGVTRADLSYVADCRDPRQLMTSNTYHRMALIRKPGVVYSVHMYALYFMKDKDLPLMQVEGGGGHRHDWEFALVWKTNGAITHVSTSAHGRVITRARSHLHFDAAAPDNAKVVYHKDGPSTHAMRFAGQGERAENHLGRWVTPPLVDWYQMRGDGVSNSVLRKTLNEYDFGHANCSINDVNFGREIGKSPPDGYPRGRDWELAGASGQVARVGRTAATQVLNRK